MNKQLSLFGITPTSKSYEYFFIISPDNKTKIKVKFLKERLNKTINLSSDNLFSKAHISLFKLRSKNNIDNYIINEVNEALQKKRRFKIKIQGQGILDHGNVSKSLVLHLENLESIKEINKILLASFNIPHHKISPHITIARAIPIQDFIKIAPTIDEYNYEGEFICKSIKILKRVIVGANKDKYTILHDAFLQN